MDAEAAIEGSIVGTPKSVCVEGVNATVEANDSHFEIGCMVFTGLFREFLAVRVEVNW